jgi:hypothetical protein
MGGSRKIKAPPGAARAGLAESVRGMTLTSSSGKKIWGRRGKPAGPPLNGPTPRAVPQNMYLFEDNLG